MHIALPLCPGAHGSTSLSRCTQFCLFVQVHMALPACPGAHSFTSVQVHMSTCLSRCTQLYLFVQVHMALPLCPVAHSVTSLSSCTWLYLFVQVHTALPLCPGAHTLPLWPGASYFVPTGCIKAIRTVKILKSDTKTMMHCSSISWISKGGRHAIIQLTPWHQDDNDKSM